MSQYNRNDGCSTILWLICVVPILLFALGKGCISCVEELSKSSSNHVNTSRTPIKENKKHTWGENGVDPVLRTSTGGIYQDPNYPGYYFDITTTCPQCNGKGSWETIKPNPDLYDANGNLRTNVPFGTKEVVKCSACYGTGHEKRPIPPDGKVPLKPYLKK